MAELDDTVREPQGPGPDGGGAPVYGSHRVDIAGDASAPVIAGNHNVVIDAHGSTVNLLPPRERPRPVRRRRVALVPRRQRDPVGREADLEELREALRGHGVVQLWGPPGVGKSTLLRHAARCLEPGPDGVLFLDGARREAEDLAQEIFEACYEAPGYAPTGPELRRLMAGVEVTVYVDDADLEPEKLRLLTDAAPDATFVLASRERSLLGEGGALELRGLGRAAGLDLLGRALGRSLRQGERAAAEELCAVALGRPLLLLRAAGLARPDARGQSRLPPPAGVDGLVPLLFDRLDPAAADVLHLLATLRDAEVDPAHVGALCEVPDPAGVCGRLAELGLVSVTERGYRGVADVLPEVRRRFPAPFPADRLCDHFARWAALPTTTPAQIADHGRALETAAAMAERCGRPDLAVQLARAVSPFLPQSLRFGVWGRLLDQGQSAARQADDPTAHAYFTHEKAIRCLLVGQRVVAAVLLAEAVVLWHQLGDEAGVDAALNAQQYTPPLSPPAPDAQPPGDGLGTPFGDGPAVPEAGPGGAPATDAGPAPGHDSGWAPGHEPGTAPAYDPGTAPAYDPGTAPGYDPGSLPATDLGSVPGYDLGPPPGHAPAPASPADAPAAPGHDLGTTPANDHGAASAADAGARPGGDTGWSSGTDTGWSSGADPWAAPNTAADPVTQAAAHSSGTVGASTVGAVTTGGAPAAVGAGALWAGLIALAVGVVAAVAIGAVVYANRTSDDHRPTSLREVSGSASRPVTGSTPDPSTSPAPADELAGVWRDGEGNVFVIAASGQGSYRFRTAGTCGDTRTVTVTGRTGDYSGRMPVWDESACGEILGELELSIDVASDGSRARVVTTAPANGKWECSNCGTGTWTRLS
ncbi:ATP-binding protein [Streptomyces pratensis]|uniref:ATP-binding protein n=1 Tax=Streptomyces pratensis TaxID=1169025 RepID=UPI0030159E95